MDAIKIIPSILIGLSIFISTSSHAIDANVTNVSIKDITVVNTNVNGHTPGDLQITILGGISNLGGANCSADHVTTPHNGAQYQEMLMILLAAMTNNKTVNLGITDNPVYNAVLGRCSLTYVSINN